MGEYNTIRYINPTENECPPENGWIYTNDDGAETQSNLTATAKLPDQHMDCPEKLKISKAESTNGTDFYNDIYEIASNGENRPIFNSVGQAPTKSIIWDSDAMQWTITGQYGHLTITEFSISSRDWCPPTTGWIYTNPDDGSQTNSELAIEVLTIKEIETPTETYNISTTPVTEKEPEKWGFVSSLHAVGPNETDEVIIDAPCEHIGMGYLALSSEKIITYQDFTGREFESEYFSVTSLSNKTGDQLAPPVSMKYSGDNDYAWGFAAFWWCEEEQRR